MFELLVRGEWLAQAGPAGEWRRSAAGCVLLRARQPHGRRRRDRSSRRRSWRRLRTRPGNRETPRRRQQIRAAREGLPPPSGSGWRPCPRQSAVASAGRSPKATTVSAEDFNKTRRSVQPHALTGFDGLRPRSCADDGGNAELARHDRRVRKRAARVGDETADLREEHDP